MDGLGTKRWILNAVEEDQPRAQGYKIESKKKKKEGTSYDNPDITNHVIPFYLTPPPPLLPVFSPSKTTFFSTITIIYYIEMAFGKSILLFCLILPPTHVSHTLAHSQTIPLQSVCFSPQMERLMERKKRYASSYFFFTFAWKGMRFSFD
ncbi:hypothetical protein TWF706_008967 [Orbilia oligospora]|nr:hypothetical protein TWF706_008967 [Orbilia oligospora]